MIPHLGIARMIVEKKGEYVSLNFNNRSNNKRHDFYK